MNKSILIFTTLLAIQSSSSYAFESYDDQLRKIAEVDNSFAGLYQDGNGNTVVSIVSKSSGEESAKLDAAQSTNILKSYDQVKNILQPNLLEALEVLYGKERFLHEESVGKLNNQAGFSAKTTPNISVNREVRIRPVTFSFADLYDWYQVTKLQIFTVDGVIGADIDEAKNRISVIISTETSTDLSHLKEIFKSYGIPVKAYGFEISEPIELNTTLRDETIPLTGGPQIFRRDTANPNLVHICSTGFIADINGQTGMITASHCTELYGLPDNSVFYQGSYIQGQNSTLIGPATLESQHAGGVNCPASRRCLNSDSAFIPIPEGLSTSTSVIKTKTLNSSPVNLEPKTGSRRVWSSLFDFGTVVVGDKVYKTGRTTGTTSGVISDTCVDLAINNSIIFLNCHMQVTADTSQFGDRGDSGSAALGAIGGADTLNYTYNYGKSARILGLYVAGSSGGSIGYFSPINSISQDLGQLSNFR